MSSDSKSSRRRTDSGLPLGYVPPPPGASDPFDDPGQFSSSNTEEPPTEDETPFEDELAGPSPVMANATPLPAPSTDPRELARKLAEEARARATASTQQRAEPLPEPPAAPPPKKKGLADRAPAPRAEPKAATPVPAPRAAEPAPAPQAAAEPAQASQQPEAKKRSLADRARRPVSAAEALRLAAEAEKEDAAAKKKAKAESAAAARPKPRKAPAPEPAAPAHAVADVLGRLVPGATVQRELPVTNPVVFRALWTAHRARAASGRDVGLLVTAGVLLDAVERLPKGCLVAAQATVADHDVAVWVDVARGVVLGVAEPSEVYLAGL